MLLLLLQIVAVIAGTAALALVDGPLGISTGIETIGSHFGAGKLYFPLRTWQQCNRQLLECMNEHHMMESTACKPYY
jgi:hypothetical protein